MEEVIENMGFENRQQFEAILRSKRKEKIYLNLDPKEFARLQRPSWVSLLSYEYSHKVVLGRLKN